MQSSLLEYEKPQALDATNAEHLHAVEALLDRGDVSAACEELRRIQRRVAGHPAVIKVRRQLVNALLGLNET